MIVIIGIDPGKKGGIAFIFENGTEAHPMPETDRDIYDLLESRCDKSDNIIVFMEQVHGIPGAASMFKFGDGYGFLRGIVTALKYPIHLVLPTKWQKFLGCLTGGDKNISKQKAQQLFPLVKNITHSTADALLIAEYGRRTLIVGHPTSKPKKSKFNHSK